ncbi:MAG: tRNA lysidine(34) synthetase TilS [Pseudomonadota bacterium]
MRQPLGSQALLRHLQKLVPRAAPLHCVVAFSGGLDSVALLHCLAQARQQFPGALALRAVHVDHHLQEAATQFRAFCRRFARHLDVALTVRDAHVQVPRGASLEEAARLARYELLKSQLRPGELLLTAQHADDQMETVLLALLRGAGPSGLAAMPPAVPFGTGKLVRPLLDMGRAALVDYVNAAGLEWIEDPSNEQLRFDRNYLRAKVVPQLRERWPSVAQTIGRSARHCAEAQTLLDKDAARDLELSCDGPDLEVAVLRRWHRMRQKAVLRCWFTRRGARVPDERRLDEALRMFDARPDASPSLSWPGARLRRYHGRLILEVGKHPANTIAGDDADALQWDWRQPLALPGGDLVIRHDAQGDLDLDRLPESLTVQLGPGLKGGRRLRNLLQQLEIPTWQRGALPLLYAAGQGGSLLGVRDLWLAGSLHANSRTTRRGRIVWA